MADSKQDSKDSGSKNGTGKDSTPQDAASSDSAPQDASNAPPKPGTVDALRLLVEDVRHFSPAVADVLTGILDLIG